MKATLSLGSNLGDRLGYLQGALDALSKATGTHIHSVSAVYETDPVGGPDQGEYLNAVVVLKTILSPQQLLAVAQQIETDANRVREVHWGPRTLDIDILAMDSEVIDTEDLVLPHPRAHERAFVLLPWSMLDPNFVIPGRASVESLLAQVGSAGVRLREDLKLVVSP